jgi:hypothetical protein
VDGSELEEYCVLAVDCAEAAETAALTANVRRHGMSLRKGGQAEEQFDMTGLKGMNGAPASRRERGTGPLLP